MIGWMPRVLPCTGGFKQSTSEFRNGAVHELAAAATEAGRRQHP
eukprot:CAMPEP_0117687844 /NCGR_PEP_ID=MMETSP0804-20121206/23406_1 /TAXON_ID=1074897 /ORGANISM="Tetraselmis astigmatica, Strain CCMP880" /LENGTH=43 /DNA_ID= /DNA_START= /DNA_END= /DNA_ORIENTATION=